MRLLSISDIPYRAVAVKTYVMKQGSTLKVMDDQEGLDKFSKLKNGTYSCTIKSVNSRCLVNHRRYFKLLKMAYDNWDNVIDNYPADGTKRFPIENTNFDHFRQDIIILAGFYAYHYAPDASLAITADSISFDNMPEDKFQDLFDKTIDVIIQHILPETNRQDLIEEVLTYS